MNNNILNPSSNQTMTLKEITDLLGIRHNDAMKAVEKMAESPEFGELRKIRSSYINNLDASIPIETYELDKRQSMAVSAKLNTAMLMRVIDRWQELESAPKKLPTHLDVISGMVEVMRDQEQKITAIENKVDALVQDVDKKIEQVAIKNRNGVPLGFLGKKSARNKYGLELSQDIFNLAMVKLNVISQQYTATVEDGYEVVSTAFKESEIQNAITLFIEDSIQVTTMFCQSPLLDGRRFKFHKEELV